jgi:three-Cys-motif partner protein
VTQQVPFGGSWTQQKLQILSKYLRAYRTIFDKNARARYYRISYVDAFAGTGVIPRPEVEESLIDLMPSMLAAEKEFRKGSVRRALEIEPPFDEYVFVERDQAKCEELSVLKVEFPHRTITVVNDDANDALLRWCEDMDTKRQRGVVFLDPFGASVEWRVIEAIAKTRAVDLWILFPYSAVNRMLTRDRKPSPGWCEKLTRVFGTAEWEKEFYASVSTPSLLFPDQDIESVCKTADKNSVVQFFARRLETAFTKVPSPGLLFNSRSLLFVFYFAGHNDTGARIASDLLRKLPL